MSGTAGAGEGDDGAAVVADHAPFLDRLFDRQPDEVSHRIPALDGELPSGLRGTYRVNGPARFEVGVVRYRHWLDGDGYVASLQFDGDPDGPRFTGRFVRSRKWEDEAAAGRAIYRAFGTRFAGDRLARTGLASPVNVSVHPFAGRLLAFGEQGLPYRLDPETLATLGEEDFDRLSPMTPFSAHPGLDPATGEMVNFGISFAADRPILQLFRFAPNGELTARFRMPLDRPVSVHDFGLSPRFAVFYLAPYLLDVRALLEEGATVLEALAWRPELGTRLLVLAREDGRVVLDLPIGERYCLHHVNCWEDGDRLFVDVIELEEPVYPDYDGVPDLFAKVASSHPTRLVVDLAAGRLAERHEIPYREAADFPAHHPALRGRHCRDSFMLSIGATGRPGRKFFDRLVRLDWERMEVAATYTAPPGRYLGGEPIVLPHADGDLVLCQEVAAEHRRSRLLLFSAAAIEAGPVAALPLASYLPPGFHASWEPGP